MGEDLLPHGATAESQIRCQMASELVRRFPPALGHEVAVTGSVGHGVADEDSDIELNFWVEMLPPRNEWLEWRMAAGATDLVVDAEPIETGSIWVTCRFSGVWVEAG
jgi:hypothetical protein